MHILLGKKSKVLFLFLIFLHETSSIKLDGFNLFFLENFVCRKMEFSAGSQMGRDPRRWHEIRHEISTEKRIDLILLSRAETTTAEKNNLGEYFRAHTGKQLQTL